MYEGKVYKQGGKIMISVDFSAIEELKNVMKKASIDSEETLVLLKRTLAEMQDNLEFQTYVQASSSEEAVLEAINALTRTNERISALKNIKKLNKINLI